MPAPNQEQLKAIEHSGGVLLKAGAGSGKTFVLKEHIIYLSRNWIQEFKQTPQIAEDFSGFIKAKFRKIVLMTFTKYAAGELEIRLEKEFSAVVENEHDDKEYWVIIKDNIQYLRVSTIHGFCSTLIRMGFISTIPTDFDLVTDSEYHEFLSQAFDSFLEKELFDNPDDDFIHYILKDKSNILKSIKTIFADATLRISWQEIFESKNPFSELDQIVDETLEIKGLDFSKIKFFNLDPFDSFSGKKWFDFSCEFQKAAMHFEKGIAGYLQAYQYFEARDFKIPARRGIPDEFKDFYNLVVDLKDEFKKNGEHYSMFMQHQEGFFCLWFERIKNLIQYIDAEYSQKEGLTFADLEYLVYKGLENSEVSKRISEEFNYLIIDEFQDTSFIQYEIIKKVIQGDFSKLFCVGDPKQAIYGFRGGELEVFNNCETQVPQALSMKNNYRSDKNVIDFNNVLFDKLFHRGEKFEGIDPHAVVVEYQNVPETKTELGEIYQLSPDLAFIDDEQKIDSRMIEYIEAQTLLNQIVKLRDREEEIAVLYRKMRPSLFLINLLIKNDIGFSAQVKIPYLDDPIIGVFKTLIEKDYNQNELNTQYQLLTIETYLAILLGKSIDVDLENTTKQFYKEVKYFGLYQSFLNFLERCKISNSIIDHNLEFLKKLIESAGANSETILLNLSEQTELSYKFVFCYGQNSNLVKIMTAHGSKGLEFKHVLLGGIYTNDKSMSNTAMMGSMPMSLKWSPNLSDKKKFKTPFYILEDLIKKQKELSEHKRLFYVANTRAQSTLGWASLQHLGIKPESTNANSWAQGFNTFFNEFNFEFKKYECDISENYSEIEMNKLKNKMPFFHMNSLGNILSQKDTGFYLSELSVTKMTSLAECPRKFYFQNICKFSEDEMELFEQKHQNSIFYETDDLSSRDFQSAASRGSQIHEILSEVVQAKNNQHPALSERPFQHLSQTVEKLESYFDNSEMISEKPIKFEIFGYMISGIPDLIIRPLDENAPIEIWDFKTGKYSESKLSPYFFQLYSYAYAQFSLNQILGERPIKLVLCFVDENKNVEKNVLSTDVENYLTGQFNKLLHPEVKNLDYCEYCSFSPICEK